MKQTFTVLLACFCAVNLSAQNLTGKILYSHYTFGATNPDSIFALTNNGQTRTFVTLGFRPRLSHHGHYMAFSNGSNNSSYDADMWLRDLTLMHDTLVFAQGDYLDYYDFSPTDTKIAYSATCSMYTTNLDGTASGSDIGCNPCDCYSDDPTVRVSDSMITYHNVHYGIYTKNFDGTNSTQVPHTYPGDLYPIWSPDGQWIVFEKTTPTLYYVTNNLYKIKPDGNDSTQLTFFATADTLTADPVWASDMQSIYVIGRVNGNMGMYRVSTSGNGNYVTVKPFSNGGSVWDYWLGLADSISSTPLSVSLPLQQFASIYPNPATDNVIVAVNSKPASPLVLSLTNALGQVVMEVPLTDWRQTMNIRSLPAGIYSATIVGNNATQTLKLVKQ